MAARFTSRVFGRMICLGAAGAAAHGSAAGLLSVESEPLAHDVAYDTLDKIPVAP